MDLLLSPVQISFKPYSDSPRIQKNVSNGKLIASKDIFVFKNKYPQFNGKGLAGTPKKPRKKRVVLPHDILDRAVRTLVNDGVQVKDMPAELAQRVPELKGQLMGAEAIYLSRVRQNLTGKNISFSNPPSPGINSESQKDALQNSRTLVSSRTPDPDLSAEESSGELSEAEEKRLKKIKSHHKKVSWVLSSDLQAQLAECATLAKDGVSFDNRYAVRPEVEAAKKQLLKEATEEAQKYYQPGTSKFYRLQGAIGSQGSRFAYQQVIDQKGDKTAAKRVSGWFRVSEQQRSTKQTKTRRGNEVKPDIKINETAAIPFSPSATAAGNIEATPQPLPSFVVTGPGLTTHSKGESIDISANIHSMDAPQDKLICSALAPSKVNPYSFSIQMPSSIPSLDEVFHTSSTPFSNVSTVSLLSDSKGELEASTDVSSNMGQIHSIGTLQDGSVRHFDSSPVSTYSPSVTVFETQPLYLPTSDITADYNVGIPFLNTPPISFTNTSHSNDLGYTGGAFDIPGNLRFPLLDASAPSQGSKRKQSFESVSTAATADEEELREMAEDFPRKGHKDFLLELANKYKHTRNILKGLQLISEISQGLNDEDIQGLEQLGKKTVEITNRRSLEKLSKKGRKLLSRIAALKPMFTNY